MHVEAGRRNVAGISCVPFYLFAFVYLALPALLLLAYAPVIGMLDHRQINLDYLLIGAISVFLPRPWRFALLLSEFVADSICQICIIYQIAPSQLPIFIRYTQLLPVSRLVGGGLVLVLGVAVCVALSLLQPRRNQEFRVAGTLLGILIFLIAVDVGSGQSFLWRTDVRLLPKIMRSPAVSLVRHESFYRGLLQHSKLQEDTLAPSASSRLTADYPESVIAERGVNVVLVLVESWGMMDDVQAAHGLVDAYADPLITNSYFVKHGTVPFHGGTVAGEARELCHSGMELAVIQISDGRAARCLPHLMQQQGYHTVGVHGFAGGMFLRNQWYPRMGFDESWFLPDLEKTGLPLCKGTFPGVCDLSIAQRIGQRLLAEPPDQPQFVYWVTLNSHIPVPAQTDIADDGSCVTRLELKSSTALCSWYRLVRAVHKGMAEDAIKLRERPTVFLIVGDHAPPFGDPALRQRFSQTEVPYILLVPSSLERDHGGPAHGVLGERMLVAKGSTPHTREGTTRDAEP